MSAGPLVLAAAIMSRRLHGPNRWVRILPLIALAGALAAGAFGRAAILSGIPTWMGGIDLFSALTAMTSMGVAAVMVGSAAHGTARRSAPGPQPLRVFSLAAMSLAVLVAMHVSGIFAAGKGSYTRCLGWPIWQRIDTDLQPWLQNVWLGLAGLGAVLVLTTVVVAVRDDRLRRWGIALGTLFAAEMVLGQVIRAAGLNKGVAAGYSVMAVALVSCLGLLMAVTWPTRQVAATEATPQQPELAGVGG